VTRRRLLVVSYFYPPFSSVGAGRVSKMTKYLADYGWDATVLTIDHDDRPANMEIEVPVASIHRVPQAFDVLTLPRTIIGRSTVPQRRFVPSNSWASNLVWRLGMVYRNVVCFPDPQIGWFTPAVREGLRIIRDTRPDAILTSSSPTTCHLIGASLTKQTGVPWIAEFRDLWTDNHNFRRTPPLRLVERWLERRTLARARALVTVSDVWADKLARRFGKPAHVVPNGFDPTDYSNPTSSPSSTFSLVYTGMFYNGKQNAAPIIEAIAALSRDGVITPETFQLRLVGHYLEPIAAAAEKAGLRRFIDLGAPVPYREALGIQRDATALLFLDWSDGREKGWYSAKVYEYLGAERPILSVGPRTSVVAALLDRTRAGVAGETAADIRETLEAWLQEFRATGRVLSRSDHDALAAFQRQAAAKQMAAILDGYVKGR
jgi:glycosyltransferase involved in cell wall biosynthesis